MTTESKKPPTVFISYSWTTTDHEQWVYELATRLMSDGVMVKLDKWDLKEGNDTLAFMESMVTSTEIDKVLIICERGYQAKADKRTGGVGTETELITPKIYGNVGQEKFIPVVSERDEEGKPFLPTFCSSRMYVDLSIEYEKGYERLLRTLHQAPMHRKPALGAVPSFLFEQEVSHYESSNLIKQLNSAIENNPKRVRGITSSFINTFLGELKQLEITSIDNPSFLDETVKEKIDESLPLRNVYINFINSLSESDEIDSDWIVELFESLYPLAHNQKNNSYYESQFDQFKFFITELFIYTCAILIKHNQYKVLSEVFNSEFHTKNFTNDNLKIRFEGYRFYIESLERLNERLGYRKFSYTGEILSQRADNSLISKEEFLNTDLLLHYISKILRPDERYFWFPTTYMYRSAYSHFKLLSKLKSKRHAEKIKCIFNADTIEELKLSISSYSVAQPIRVQNDYFNQAPHIASIIKPDEIATML
ncbi:toll/interleukin-1 receptor domain-containing protein [Paenibacillus sp. FSL L8-0502]|uniref:toll/interleukin-1 receptor domain-containing protein n=1 Tax=Paenibacillus sp. FSL L8-0502 TaxID=2954619 RepID=UPI0031583C81